MFFIFPIISDWWLFILKITPKPEFINQNIKHIKDTPKQILMQEENKVHEEPVAEEKAEEPDVINLDLVEGVPTQDISSLCMACGE